MKILIKLLLTLFVMFGIFAMTDTALASTPKEKIYSEYSLPKEAKKFPIKLTNGLTITTMTVKGKTVPVIKKDSKTVWQGTALATNSKIRFTVSKNQDTFFYHRQIEEGTYGNITLIGINKNGAIFLNESVTDNVPLNIDFVSDNLIELATNSPFAPSVFYQLYKNGDFQRVDYFDKAFINLVKKGQLKWNPGAIGTTYKNLKPKIAHLNSRVSAVETELLVTWKSNYNFGSSSRKEKKFGIFEDDQKVASINERVVYANHNETKALLKKYLGNPTYSNETYDMYRIGKNVLSLHYHTIGSVVLYLESESNNGKGYPVFPY